MRLIRLLIVLLLASMPSWGQCASFAGTWKALGVITLTCTTTPPPPTLTIPPGQTLPNGTINVAYSGVINVTGGVQPYIPSIISGGLPTGISVAGATGQINFTGTSTQAGTFNFTLQVQDSELTPQTATAALTLTINTVTSSCGFPKYPCSRNDYAAQPMSSTACAAGVICAPPAIGSQTAGGPLVTSCSPGTTGTNNLTNCGMVFGTNTISHDPFYNNITLIRATDINNWLSTNPGFCGTGLAAAPGGDTGQNDWSIDDQYIMGTCQGHTFVIWFNPDPITPHVMTNAFPGGLNKLGYVENCDGSIFQPNYSSAGGMQFSYTVPDKFFGWSKGYHIVTNTIANGQIANCNGTVNNDQLIVDFSFGIPCWQPNDAAQGLGPCPAWTASNTYSPGSSIIPVGAQNTLSHVFQLLNTSPCTSGASQPNWGATVASNESKVYNDGACQWADIGPIDISNFGDHNSNSHDDTKWTDSFTNFLGQDSSGFCFAVYYDSVLNMYSHFNTCTGNVFNTTCSHGTGFQCTGGSWSQVYVGNIIPSTHPLFWMHNGFPSMSLKYFQVGGTHCALTLNGAPFHCPSVPYTPSTWQTGTGNNIFLVNFLNPSNPAAVSLGHETLGFNGIVFAGGVLGSTINPFSYMPYVTIPGDVVSFNWSVAGAPGPGPGPFPNCTPNACPGFYLFDEHGSWVSNPGNDATPFCTFMTNGTDQVPGIKAWVPQYPWYGEIICASTDGSNNVARQLYGYNTMAESPQAFAAFENGLTMSHDGAYVMFASDWWCTLGNLQGGTQSTCGLPFQPGHAYSTLGELTAPAPSESNPPGYVYKVTTTGTSQNYPTWCLSVGCTVSSGTVTFTNVGLYNAQFALFIARLQ